MSGGGRQTSSRPEYSWEKSSLPLCCQRTESQGGFLLGGTPTEIKWFEQPRVAQFSRQSLLFPQSGDEFSSRLLKFGSEDSHGRRQSGLERLGGRASDCDVRPRGRELLKPFAERTGRLDGDVGKSNWAARGTLGGISSDEQFASLSVRDDKNFGHIGWPSSGNRAKGVDGCESTTSRVGQRFCEHDTDSQAGEAAGPDTNRDDIQLLGGDAGSTQHRVHFGDQCLSVSASGLLQRDRINRLAGAAQRDGSNHSRCLDTQRQQVHATVLEAAIWPRPVCTTPQTELA